MTDKGPKSTLNRPKKHRKLMKRDRKRPNYSFGYIPFWYFCYLSRSFSAFLQSFSVYIELFLVIFGQYRGLFCLYRVLFGFIEFFLVFKKFFLVKIEFFSVLFSPFSVVFRQSVFGAKNSTDFTKKTEKIHQDFTHFWPIHQHFSNFSTEN